MSKRFYIHVLLPIEKYVEDKIYDRDDIKLSAINYKPEIDHVYYKRLKEKAVYASINDIASFTGQKYSLGEIHGYSMCWRHDGGYMVNYQDKEYLIEAEEVKQLEKEHISETVYCNRYAVYSLSWFYTSIGKDLLPNDFAIIDDILIEKATKLLGYETDENITECLGECIESEESMESKFVASLILAKEIAKRMNGRAVLEYE